MGKAGTQGTNVSDITKKIFSIEQTEEVRISSEPSTSDIIRPLSDETTPDPLREKSVEVPKFVTREAVQPLSAPPEAIDIDVQPSKPFGWVIAGFGALYLIGVGLYFGLPIFSEPVKTLSITGLVLLLTLPLFLLFLLWRSLRHLTTISLQNNRLTKAAAVLVSPDQEALAKTTSLASGIQTQISYVNNEMEKTVETLKEVQLTVSRESQALDSAGLALSNRSDDLGRNLTLQRQALESMSGTFDTRMSTLSTQITESGQTLEEICKLAETKLLNAGEALKKASAVVDETVNSGSARLSENVTTLDETSRKLNETTETITTNLTASAESLRATDGTFLENSGKLSELMEATQTQISDLQATIGHGYEMIADLKAETENRSSTVAAYYEELFNQLKRSEDDTLTAQGETARMVQSNLAQMRRDFSKMETDLQSLQSKLSNLKHASSDIPVPEPAPARLKLMPLESDFPPVEPPRTKVTPEPVKLEDKPLNLGMDMEIETADDPLLKFNPDVIRRPGTSSPKPKGKGFGRRTETEEKTGWRWRDMLGTLDRPETRLPTTPLPASMTTQDSPSQDVDGVALLTTLKLSPAAIVDEGTVIEATQARINKGEAGLTSVVIEKLPEAVSHLKANLRKDTTLEANLKTFTAEFSQTIGNTPPTAPALRAALGSSEGRAYLLCAAAFKPELRT